MRRSIPATLSLLILASCGGGGETVAPPPPPPPPAPVASVALSASGATLVPQQATQLTATPKDAAGNPLSGRAVTWSSSASTIASVNAGLVTAAAVGSATITATSEGRSAQATITVQDGGLASAGGGTINAAGGAVSLTLPAQAVSGPLALTVAPAANPPAGVIAGTAFEFGPSGTQFAQPVTLKIQYDAAQVPPGADPTLFRIHLLNGSTWEAVPGSTVDVATRTVTATITHFSAYAVAQAPVPVTSLELSPLGDFSLAVGSTYSLSATPKDAAGHTLSNAVTWSSSATTIASVNAGVVTGIAPGSSVISASSGGVSAQVVVTVTAAVQFALSQVSPGYHTCGLTPAGEAWCWGRNQDGEIGDGTNTQRRRPVRVTGGHVFTQIAVGLYHTCALKANGSVWCWGNNAEGELGDGTFASRNTPAQVPGITLVDISAGSLHSCGRTVAGAAWCWGDNRYGMLGDGTLMTRNRPVAVVSAVGVLTFVQISAGQDRTCGVALSGDPWCWGGNGGGINSAFPDDVRGILGVGNLVTPITQPFTIAGAIVTSSWQFAEVSAGYRYSCARTPANVIRCWGANTYTSTKGGQLGNGSLTVAFEPELIAAGGETFSSIHTGFTSACALSTAGEAWCWGVNYGGEAGDGGPTDFPNSQHHPTPIRVVGGHRFASLDIGKLNACGIKANGETWCWGYNLYGEIGDGTNVNRSSPTLVSP